MRKLPMIAAAASAVAVAFALAACGGSGAEEVFEWADYYEVSVNSHEVVFDEEEGCDAIVVNVTVENIADDAHSFSNVNNVNAYIGEESLSNDYTFADQSAADTELAKGDSIDLVYSWKLDDYGELRMSFMGYSSATETYDVTIDVSDAETDEHKAAVQAAADELAAKQSVTNADLGACTVEATGDWYFDELSDSRVTLMIPDQSGSVKVYPMTTSDGAKDTAARYAGNYNPAPDVVEESAGGVTYYVLKPVDDQFLAFADASNGQVVEISGMFYSWEDASSVIEKVTIK